jgi:S-formylglutathione hydrolase
MGWEVLSEHACFGGVQGFYRHTSSTIGLPMRVGVYRPPQALAPTVAPLPALIYLAGLTCNEETFAIKAGAQRVAAELGLLLVTPDTSPRGTNVAGADDAWDFGTAAGFYLDATQRPGHRTGAWKATSRRSCRRCWPNVLPCRPGRRCDGPQHGRPRRADAGAAPPGPVCQRQRGGAHLRALQCPWGVKAFAGYLGADRAAWAAHDATELIKAGHRVPPLLHRPGRGRQVPGRATAPAPAGSRLPRCRPAADAAPARRLRPRLLLHRQRDGSHLRHHAAALA